MKKQSIIGLLALTLAVFASSCKKSNEFQTTEDGLKYKYIVNSDSGEVAGPGGYLEMHIVVTTHSDSLNKDTTLSNSYTSGYGVNKLLISDPTYKGCINGGFAMLKAGDSVVFKVLADSLYQKTFGQPVPPFLTGKEDIIITTKVLVSESKASFDERQKKEKEEQARAQQKLLETEQKELKAVAEKMGYGDKLQLSPSGLYFVKLKETNGPTPVKGDVASFFYKGTFMDGKEFDSNYGGRPFNVTIGSGGAISGWLEVVDKIKLGEKWMLFIPSSLAYGERGQGSIPPNTPLVFEMSLDAIRTAEQVEKERKAEMEKLAKEETKLINKFLAGKNYKKDTERDIYYIVDDEGRGNYAKFNDKVKMKVKGFDLKGNPIKEFTIVDPPIESLFKQGAFPAAMELALLKLKAGGEIRIVTPSRHFQGETGGGVIGAYTPVYLELELVSIEKGK